MLQGLTAFWRELTARPDFWGFISIPLVAAVVTWAHVWLAMKMVFYPIEFHGLLRPWLGWQGIVPRKAAKMADIVVRNTLGKIASLTEIFSQLEPIRLAGHISAGLAGKVEKLIDGVMQERHPELWSKLPPAMRQPFYEQARKQVPSLIEGMMKELGDHIDEYLDLRAMVVRRMTTDRRLIVEVFQEVGDREIAFVVSSSFFIGMGFGVLQMVLWYFVPFDWGLPLYGAALGYLTNWVALNLVFRPLHAVRVGPFRIQGLFLKRQPEVAEKFAAVATEEMLTVKQIMGEVMNGERAVQTRALLGRHLTPLLEGGLFGAAIRPMLGPKGIEELREAVVTRAARLVLEPMDDPELNRDRAAAIARIFCERMVAMRPAEFQDVLRPAFHEDEWILLVLGGILGFLSGWVQLVLGFR